MAQRRKSISEEDVKTILAVFESIEEHCGYSWGKMNEFMGSMVIDRMQDLKLRLTQWNKDNEDSKTYWDEWN